MKQNSRPPNLILMANVLNHFIFPSLMFFQFSSDFPKVLLYVRQWWQCDIRQMAVGSRPTAPRISFHTPMQKCCRADSEQLQVMRENWNPDRNRPKYLKNTTSYSQDLTQENRLSQGRGLNPGTGFPLYRLVLCLELAERKELQLKKCLQGIQL